MERITTEEKLLPQNVSSGSRSGGDVLGINTSSARDSVILRDQSLGRRTGSRPTTRVLSYYSDGRYVNDERGGLGLGCYCISGKINSLNVLL